MKLSSSSTRTISSKEKLWVPLKSNSLLERSSPSLRSSFVSPFVVVSLVFKFSRRVSLSHRDQCESRESTESNWIRWQRKLSCIRLSAHTEPQNLSKQANRSLRSLSQKQQQWSREEGRDYSSKITTTTRIVDKVRKLRIFPTPP